MTIEWFLTKEELRRNILQSSHKRLGHAAHLVVIIKMSSANGNKITSSLALINTSIIIPYPQFFGISEVNQLVHESTLFLFQHNVFRLQIPANQKVNWGEVEDNKNRQSKALPVNYSSIVEVAERWSDIVENCQNLSNQHFTTFQTLSKPTCPSSRPLVAAGLLRSLLRSPEGNRLKLGFFDFFKTCFAKLHAEGGQLPGGREVKTLKMEINNMSKWWWRFLSPAMVWWLLMMFHCNWQLTFRRLQLLCYSEVDAN